MTCRGAKSQATEQQRADALCDLILADAEMEAKGGLDRLAIAGVLVGCAFEILKRGGLTRLQSGELMLQAIGATLSPKTPRKSGAERQSPPSEPPAREARASARPKGPERDSAKNSPEGLQGENR